MAPNDSSDKGIEKMIADNCVEADKFFRSTATDTNVSAENVNTAARRERQYTSASQIDYAESGRDGDE